MGINIRYLSELAEILAERKGKTFRLLVDMRDWQAPNTPSAKRIKAAFQLDRRNQHNEVWLQNDATDDGGIADKFFNMPNFKLKIVNSVQQFLEYACAKDSDEVKSYIADWVADTSIDKQN